MISNGLQRPWGYRGSHYAEYHPPPVTTGDIHPSLCPASFPVAAGAGCKPRCLQTTSRMSSQPEDGWNGERRRHGHPARRTRDTRKADIAPGAPTISCSLATTRTQEHEAFKITLSEHIDEGDWKWRKEEDWQGDRFGAIGCLRVTTSNTHPPPWCCVWAVQGRMALAPCRRLAAEALRVLKKAHAGILDVVCRQRGLQPAPLLDRKGSRVRRSRSVHGRPRSERRSDTRAPGPSTHPRQLARTASDRKSTATTSCYR